MITVWVNKQKGQIALSWDVYAAVEWKHTTPFPIELAAYQYVGIALENSNGVTCVFNKEALDHFEYVGEL